MAEMLFSPVLHETGKLCRGAVRRAVIDDNHRLRMTQCIFDDRRNGGGLVERGDDDRDSHLGGAQIIAPLTPMIWPDMYEASSDTRNATRAATSSARPARFMGTKASI